MDASIIPMVGFGWQELLIILVIAMLLFGGSRLAGIGKSSGRAIREFKEETRDLKKDEQKGEADKTDESQSGESRSGGSGPSEPKAIDSREDSAAESAVDAEIVDAQPSEQKNDDLR